MRLEWQLRSMMRCAMLQYKVRLTTSHRVSKVFGGWIKVDNMHFAP